MSMYRQMWLAIILSTLLALMGGLLASTLNARSYLSEQLNAKNTDNATALALALSQQNADPVMVELAVAALFDSGHYELVRVVDPLGKTMVERIAPSNGQFVPEWFVAALPLTTNPGRAQISNGWNQLGTLTVVSTSRYAYQSLWKSVLQLTLALGLSGVVGGFLGTLVLRRLREPLERVINQASAISERRFVLIEAPDVAELKQLATAMNGMVTRLKGMFDEEAQRLEVLRVAANYDPLTGLANRDFFLVQLLDLLDSEEATGGTLLLIRAADFPGLNHRLDVQASQDVLKAFAQALRQQEAEVHGVAARIGDSDFALLLPSQVTAGAVAEDLLRALTQATAAWTLSSPVAYIGMGKLRRGQDIAGLMLQASSALAAAQAQGLNVPLEADDDAAPASMEKTAQMIKLALEQGKVRLAGLQVLDLAGKLVHRECPLELMLDETHGWEPAARYAQVAEAFQMTARLDLAAVRLGLEKLRADPSLAGLAVNLSPLSLREASFSQGLSDLLKSAPGLTHRLWLETPEAAVIKHTESFQALVAVVRQTGGRVGLDHFGRHYSDAGVLHDLGLDFLKVDPSFIRGLQYSADNQVFLQRLASVAHKMGVQIYADGVIDRAELAALQTMEFDGAAGPAIGGLPMAPL